jgi:hypothetical protein
MTIRHTTAAASGMSLGRAASVVPFALALALSAACGSEGDPRDPSAGVSDPGDAAALDPGAASDGAVASADAGREGSAAEGGTDDGGVVDAAIPPGVPERVSSGNGYMHAITLTPGGAPTLAYGVLSGVAATPYAITVSTRGGAGWTHEPVTMLGGSVRTIDFAYDAAAKRHLGYVQYVSTSGVGYGFRIWAASDETGSFASKLLGDHSVSHNTAVGPDVDVAPTGDVHVIIPLTTALSEATSVRHLGLVGASVVDETIAPRVAGSAYGTAIGRIGAAVNAQAPLSLFTVADDSFGPDTVAYFTTPSGASATATPIGAFPDLGSSLTEIWGAALHKAPAGYVAVTANSSGNGPVKYQVLRQGPASWAVHTIGPLGYGSMGWCSTVFGDSTLALFVYAGIGVPVTATGLRMLLIAPDGTYTDRLVDGDVQSGIPCSAVADGGSVHLAYRKPDDGLYYQRVVR